MRTRESSVDSKDAKKDKKKSEEPVKVRAKSPERGDGENFILKYHANH